MGCSSYCESKGILVFLFPAYVGFQGGEQGWMQEMVANGTAKMQSYGAWIATRYQNQKNLVWMMGGDMGTAPEQLQYRPDECRERVIDWPQKRTRTAICILQRRVD